MVHYHLYLFNIIYLTTETHNSEARQQLGNLFAHCHFSKVKWVWWHIMQLKNCEETSAVFSMMKAGKECID